MIILELSSMMFKLIWNHVTNNSNRKIADRKLKTKIGPKWYYSLPLRFTSPSQRLSVTCRCLSAWVWKSPHKMRETAGQQRKHQTGSADGSSLRQSNFTWFESQLSQSERFGEKLRISFNSTIRSPQQAKCYTNALRACCKKAARQIAWMHFISVQELI